MRLNLEIIAECLRENYNVCLQSNNCNYEFVSPVIYDKDRVKDHHICVIEEDTLLTLQNIPEQVAFICSGVKESPKVQSALNIIVVEEKIESFQLLNELMDIFDKYNAWEQQLYQCAHNYDGLKQIITLGSSMLKGELLLADSNFNWIASTDHFNQYTKDCNGKNVRGAHGIITEELLKDPVFYAVRTKKDVFVYDQNESSLCCNLFRQGEDTYYGRLMFMCKKLPYTGGQIYLLRYLAGMVNKIFSQMSTFSLPISTYSSLKQVIKSILRDSAQSESLAQSVLYDLCWKSDDTYVLLQFVPAFSEDMNVHLAICSRLERLYPESCAIIYEESILLLVNISKNGGRDGFHVRSKLSEFLRENMYKAGISKFFDNIWNVKSAYKQAKAAMDIGNIKHNTYWYYYFEDYVLDYVVTTCEKELPSNYLCHDCIVILKEYDIAHGTEYEKTLRSYSLNNHSMKRTADALFIHRTTLQSRLDRIVQLTGLDLSDWNTRLHLMLSFYMKMK